MDIGKALTFVTEDPRWKEKVATGTGVVILSTILSVILIGVVGFMIVGGYMVRLMRNVQNGAPHPMPEWDQWGDDLVRGLKLVVVILIWTLPAMLFSIPVGLGGALSDGASGAGSFIGAMILFGGMCLLFLYTLFLIIAQPAITLAFARDEQIGSGLQVREIWDWTMANIGQLVIVALAYIVVSIGVSLVASIVGTLLCLIGLIVTIPLGQLVIYLFQYHLYGQLAAAYPFGGHGASTPAWTPPPAPSGTATGATDESSFRDNPYAAYGPATETPVADAPVSEAPATTVLTPEPPISTEAAPDTTVLGESGAPDAPASDTVTSDAVAPDGDESYPESGIDEEKPKQ